MDGKQSAKGVNLDLLRYISRCIPNLERLFYMDTLTLDNGHLAVQLLMEINQKLNSFCLDLYS